MTASKKTGASGRTILFLIALAFFGPMALAMWMYFSGQDVELGANHGLLLEPFDNVAEASPELRETVTAPWVLAYVNRGDCGDKCRDALYLSRQSRTMLGREMDRLDRLFLHGSVEPDTLFLDQEHSDLARLQSAGLADALTQKTPEDVASGGFYLIDPIGNLVLYFPPDINPKDMVADIKRLLKISQIG